MLSAILLVIEQRKNEFDRIAKVRFMPSIAKVISLSGPLPGSIFMPCEGDITFQTPARISI
jgi:hypothetical protein